MPLNPQPFIVTLWVMQVFFCINRGGRLGGGMSTRRSRGFGFLAHNSLGIRV